jgi:hypothetical protein
LVIFNKNGKFYDKNNFRNNDFGGGSDGFNSPE